MEALSKCAKSCRVFYDTNKRSFSIRIENQYKAMVVKVDEVAQEWNSTWREACEVT